MFVINYFYINITNTDIKINLINNYPITKIVSIISTTVIGLWQLLVADIVIIFIIVIVVLLLYIYIHILMFFLLLIIL